jgi:S-adenosylhomocysteine hydrolase
VIDVARSALKRHESETIGREIADAIEVWLSRTSLPALRGRRALVVGHGMIGSGVARALAARGALVGVFDASPARRGEAREAGFEVADVLSAALPGRHVVVGCTGHRTLGWDEVSRLDDGTVIASASSRQIEIDMTIAARPGVRAQVIANAGPGDDRYLTWLWRVGERSVVVLSNGFPLNFNGAVETGMRDSIQKTRALMLLGAAQAAQTTTPGLHALSREMQEKLRALAGDSW